MSTTRGKLGPALVGIAVAGLAFYALKGRLGGRAAATAPTLEERLAADDRIGYLIHPCGFTLPYASDTSDVTRLLVQQLAKGQRDPIKQARAELAALGEPAVAELARRFDASYGQVFEAGIVENVLGVCTNMDGPWGLELLRRGAQHPKETVRLAAIDGLRRHGAAGDYDLVAGSLPLASSGATRADVGRCLLELDPERFCAELAGWMEDGEWRDSWKHLMPLACAPRRPETVERYAALAASVGDVELEPFLCAASARDGDAEAAAKLDAWLVDGNPAIRGMALEACARVDLVERVAARLESDDEHALRERAAQLLAGREPSERIDAWLTGGLADPSEGVRAVCMEALAARADARSIERALEMLKLDPSARSTAMRALRGAFRASPASQDRARDMLLRLFEERTRDTERASLLQALAQVPQRAAAQFLLQVGRQLEGEIEGWPAHRWCTHQILNTGRAGCELLLEELALETDPFRRIDLIAAVSSFAREETPLDDVRAALEGIVDDPATSPHERVFAASRLIRLGPSSQVAPFLKRVYLANTDPLARPALQCLLWVWYG